MVAYEIYYADVLIGHLQVENGQHQYIPDADTVRIMAEKVLLLREMTEYYPWGKPIRFFDRMIQNSKSIGREKEIYSHNNNYRMRMVSESDFV